MRLTRRAALTGLAGTSLTPAPVFAQAPALESTAPPAPPPIDPTALQTLSNLVTRMAVQVMIGEAGPYRFVVDTGAGRTSISRELAAALRLAPGPPVLVHSILESEITQTALAASLSLADIRVRDLVMPVFSRARLGVDGLLGLDVLGGRRLVFDIRGEMLHITPTGSRHLQTPQRRLGVRDAAELLRGHRWAGGMTVIEGRADRAPLSAVLDTGAQYSIGNRSLYNAIAVRRPSTIHRARPVILHGVAGQPVPGDLAILSELRLGGVRITGLPILFAALHVFDLWQAEETPTLLMGADIMRLFSRIILDLGSNEVTFHRPSGVRP
ncbi:retroviral-like aspartic protease family protein [Brevundimonas sp.]|uniref:retroviral-like aspartic protease family protein n=1 Tax=Brevundimonas sp. TaxID=1871086 RepID=UPI003919A7E7